MAPTATKAPPTPPPMKIPFCAKKGRLFQNSTETLHTKKVKTPSHVLKKEHAMLTKNKIILGNSQQMPEIEDSTIHVMVTSPPYPMIKMWDAQFGKLNPKIATLWRELEADGEERTVTQIYDAMHESLAKVWRETFRVLVDGGIACINIGDATRTINGKFRLFPNHSKIIEHCETAGFT